MTDEQKPKRQKLTPAQRIARHEQEIARLKTRVKKQSRQAETRGKIVIGGTVIAAMREDAELRARIAALLSEKVTRDIDKEAVAEWLSPTSTQA